MGEKLNNAVFRDLCRSSGVAMIATDQWLTIRFWNQAASRIFGRRSEEMHGEPILAIVPEDRRELADRLMQRAFYQQETNELEFIAKTPEGKERFLAVTISPIIDPSNKACGVSVCARDVTRRIAHEHRVAETNKMSALGSMAGGVAHHFNNLLGGVLTSIDFAQHSDDPEMLQRTLRNAMSALSRANQLTGHLLAFAEGDHSSSPVDNIREVIAQYVRDREPLLAERGIVLESELSRVDCAVPVKCLRTMLDALLDNACDAMTEQDGVLKIELKREDGDTMLLRLSDTGKGIASCDLPHIFEPFYTTKKMGGHSGQPHAGLGLPVAHGIVKDLQGTIEIRSIESHGTACEIRLPLLIACASERSTPHVQ